MLHRAALPGPRAAGASFTANARIDRYDASFLTLFVDRPIRKYKKKMHLPSRSVGDGQLLKLLGWSSTFWVAAKRVSGQAGRHTVIIY